MRRRRCPVCKKPLTQKEFDAALGILEAREKQLHTETAALQKQLAKARERVRSAKQDGRREGQEVERPHASSVSRRPAHAAVRSITCESNLEVGRDVK